MARAHDKGSSNWPVWLIISLLLAWAALEPALWLAGSRAEGQLTGMRRFGGTEPLFGHRYWWDVNYEFVTASGATHSGFRRTLARDSGPTGYSKQLTVLYFPAMPWLNVPLQDAQQPWGALASGCVGLWLLWWIRPPRRKADRKSS